jgi:hypothetical protein
MVIRTFMSMARSLMMSRFVMCAMRFFMAMGSMSVMMT